MYLEFEDWCFSFSSLELNGASHFVTFSLKFYGVLASSSLDILVLETEWLLLQFFECLHCLLLQKGIAQFGFFPSGDFMYHISLSS